MLLDKFSPLKNDIIFVDGLWGTGKSLIGPIVSGMERVEKVKIEEIYEWVCIMQHLGKIGSDAASWLLKTHADESQYNNLIGRGINLRWGDDSGFANNPNSFRYIKRMFGGEGDAKIAEINDNNLALNIMSHMLMLVADPVFEAFGDRARVIEIVRHPLYMVKHWHAYLQRFDSPREFTVCFDHKGHKVPWFAVGWEDEFIEANTMDRALLSIVRLYAWLDDALTKADAKGNRIITLSFESLVMTPEEPLRQLESFLGRRHHPRLQSILKRQKMPRKTLSQGRGHAAYGWSKDSVDSEEQVYAGNLEFVRAKGSSGNVDELLKLIAQYNIKYPGVLAQYQ